MTLNPYFNNLERDQDQKTLEALSIESIQIHGFEMYYCPKINQNLDYLFGEDGRLKFDRAYKLEGRLLDNTSWGGQKENLTRFGFEVADEIKFIISKKRFQETVTAHNPTFLKPCEGDLVCGAFQSNRLWEIKYVDHEMNYDFFQQGKNYCYELTCALLAYDQEKLETGVAEIDSVGTEFNLVPISGETGTVPVAADNDNIQTEAGTVIFDENNPFGSL